MSQNVEDVPMVMPFDVYPPKNFRIELASTTKEVTLVVKTWGHNFTSRPVMLSMNPDQANDLLRRLQKAVDGLI